MSALRRIVLLRHGNTVGDSHERFHGSGDPALSDEGRAQMRAAGHALATEVFELVAASPLRRSWQSAALLSGGASVRLVPGFREIHFGRWEGLTAQEIQERDPVLYEAWQQKAPDFEFPGGELRAAFRARVIAGLDEVAASGASNALLVVHKGVIRTLAEHLSGAPLAEGPELGKSVSLSRNGEKWLLGRRSSDPEALREVA
jgi:broad specificity phosphatase PhoE